MKQRRLPSIGRKKGFTIVELLVVIVIIGILATITIVAYRGWRQTTAENVMQSDLNGAASAMEDAKNWSSGYPASVPSTFQPSADVTLTGGGSDDGTSYCITASSANYPDVKFHISNTDSSPQTGECDTSTVTPPPPPPPPVSCPSGYIPVPGNVSLNPSEPNGFCVMKYEAKNDGNGNPTSVADGTPWVSITQADAETAATALGSGYHLISEGEWMTIAANVLSVPSNWSGGAVGSGAIYSGHNDGAPAHTLAAVTDDSQGYYGETNTGGNQLRTLTLTNGEVIWDFAGNAWEWTSGTISGGQQPGLASDTSTTYKEWNNPSLLMNGLAAVSQPSAIAAQVATWSSAQGIGELDSNYTATGAAAFARGGYYSNGAEGGVLTLNLANSSTHPLSSIGFRLAK